MTTKSISTHLDRTVEVGKALGNKTSLDIHITSDDRRGTCAWLSPDEARTVADALYEAVGSPAEPVAASPEVDDFAPLRAAGIDPARAVALTVARSLFSDYAVEDTLLAADWLLDDAPLAPADHPDLVARERAVQAGLLPREEDELPFNVTTGTPCDLLSFDIVDSDGDRLRIRETVEGSLAVSTNGGEERELAGTDLHAVIAYLERAVRDGAPRAALRQGGFSLRASSSEGELLVWGGGVFLTKEAAENLLRFLRRSA